MKRHSERDKHEKYAGKDHVVVLRRSPVPDEEPHRRSQSEKRRTVGRFNVVWEQFNYPSGWIGPPGHYEVVHVYQAQRCLQGRCNAGINPVLYGPPEGETLRQARKRKQALRRDYPDGPKQEVPCV